MRFTRANRALQVLRACADAQQACTCQQPTVRCACCGGLRPSGEAEPPVIGRLPPEGDVPGQSLPASREAMVTERIRKMTSPSPEALAARDAHLAQVAQARAYLAASVQKYL